MINIFQDAAMHYMDSDFERLLAFARKVEPWYVPVIEAARTGSISLGKIGRSETPMFAQAVKVKGNDGPLLLVVKDRGADEEGPDGWEAALNAMQWARQIVVHSTVSYAAQYSTMVLMTQMHRCVMLIECDHDSDFAWRAAAAEYAPDVPVHGPVPAPETDWMT